MTSSSTTVHVIEPIGKAVAAEIAVNDIAAGGEGLRLSDCAKSTYYT